MYLSFLSLFVNPFLSKEFTPLKYEISKEINLNLKLEEKKILKKVNGFYGQIGPNPMYYNESDDYHLFDGNGMINGVFINDNKLVFKNHWIRTDKYNYERNIKNKIPIRMDNMFKKNNALLIIFYCLLNKLNLMPNFMGTANTALWSNSDKSKVYALHERDLPYEIDINLKNKSINTIKKIKIDNINFFTAHPKIANNITYACSYNTINANVNLLKLDSNMKLIESKIINTKYVNMIHDIILSDEYIIFFDMPFKFDIERLKNDSMPFYFDKTQSNQIIFVKKDFSSIKRIKCSESFFVYHFDKVEENDKYIYIYTIIHPTFNLDLKDINESERKSTYKRIKINKKTYNYEIEKNEIFEKYNVEFPINNKDYTILSIYGKGLDIDGFMVVKNFNCLKRKMLKKRKIYAEPAITNTNCVICFTYDEKLNNYLYIYDITKDKEIEILLDVQILKGFHSIFL
jgi:carotenoid cleavage dioxygenase